MPFAWPRSVINMPDGSVVTPGFRVIKRARRRRGLGDTGGAYVPGTWQPSSDPAVFAGQGADVYNYQRNLQQAIDEATRVGASVNQTAFQAWWNSFPNGPGKGDAPPQNFWVGSVPSDYTNFGPQQISTTYLQTGGTICMGGQCQTYGPGGNPISDPATCGGGPGSVCQSPSPSYLPASGQPNVSMVVSSNGVPNRTAGGQSNAPGPVYAGGSPGGPIQQLVSGASNSPGSTYVMMPGQAAGGLDLSNLPSWVWIAIAGVGALMLFKK